MNLQDEGNKQEDFSIKMMQEIFADLFYRRDQENKRRYANVDWTPIHYVWDDEEGHHSCWKIGIAYTNDAGYEQFNEAIKKRL